MTSGSMEVFAVKLSRTLGNQCLVQKRQASKEKDILKDRQMKMERERERKGEETATRSRGRKMLLIARSESHFVFLLFVSIV